MRPISAYRERIAAVDMWLTELLIPFCIPYRRGGSVAHGYAYKTDGYRLSVIRFGTAAKQCCQCCELKEIKKKRKIQKKTLGISEQSCGEKFLWELEEWLRAHGWG